MKIIPAIDLIGGQCVRLQQGDYAKKTIYSSTPLQVALQFQAAGIGQLHLVDLDGAKDGASKNLAILQELASNTSLKIDFGGGIRTMEDFKRAFDLGAWQVTAGSIAVSAPEVVKQAVAVFGQDRILLGADHKDGTIATHGWQEGSGVALESHIESYMEMGINQVVCTDISKDGMMQGPSLSLYKDLLGQFPELSLIASGGVSSIEDLQALHAIGCRGAIVGKAFYEGAISLEDIRTFNQQYHAN